MSTRRLRIGSYAFATIACLSLACARKELTQSKQVATSLPTNNFEEPCELEVVYSTRIRPEQLTSEQLREIQSSVPAAGVGDDVWFAYVRSNRDGHYSADVYFQPRSPQGRVRRGRVVSISRSALAEAISQMMDPPPSAQPAVSEAREFVFVRPKKDLEKAIDLPTGNEMPFEVNSELTNHNIEMVVDFYRNWTPTSVSIDSQGRVNKSLPIMKIRHVGNDLELQTGVQETELSGRGQTLLLKYTPTGLELVQLGEWVS